MRYRDDPILQAKLDEQRPREPQKGARRRRYLRDVPWFTHQSDTGRSAHEVRLVLGLVMLGTVLGIVGYLLLAR
jgi:hypothetical protein